MSETFGCGALPAPLYSGEVLPEGIVSEPFFIYCCESIEIIFLKESPTNIQSRLHIDEDLAANYHCVPRGVTEGFSQFTPLASCHYWLELLVPTNCSVGLFTANCSTTELPSNILYEYKCTQSVRACKGSCSETGIRTPIVRIKT